MNSSLRKQGIAIVALSLFVLIVYSSQSNLEKTKTVAIEPSSQAAMACLTTGALGVSICSPPGAGRCMGKPGPGMDGCFCQAKIPAGGFTTGLCVAGCCKGTKFNNAKSAAKMDPVAQSGGMEGAGSGMGGLGKALGGIGQLIGQFMQGGGGGGGGGYTPTDYDNDDDDDDIVLDDDFTIPGPAPVSTTTPSTTEPVVPEVVPETSVETVATTTEDEDVIDFNLEPTSTDTGETVYEVGQPKRRVELDLFNVAKTPREAEVTESAVPEEYYIDPITGERTLRADLEWEGLQNLRNRNKDSLTADELALLEKFNESSIARSKYGQGVDDNSLDEVTEEVSQKGMLERFFAWLANTFGI